MCISFVALTVSAIRLGHEIGFVRNLLRDENKVNGSTPPREYNSGATWNK
jgi:hypothetical protein